MSHEEKLKEALTKGKILSVEQVEKATLDARNKNADLRDWLVQENLVSEAILYEALAKTYKLPFVDLKNQVVRGDVLHLIPEPFVQMHNVVAYDRSGEVLKVAMLDPDDLQITEFLKRRIQQRIEIAITTPSSIREILKQYHRGLRAEFKDITKVDEKDVSSEKDLKKLAEDLPVVRIVDTLLEYAIFEGASDIHIEPTEHDTIVRYRVDGILREVMTLPKTIHNGVVARVKILSDLKIDEHRLPQDGRFKINTDDHKVSFRVSILPVYDGEKIVLRILHESAQVLTLEQLGLQQSALELVKANIKKPHGMILVTGPTGSGKTTTLYTILNILNTPKVNISTVEDPIEYRMPRVNQTQANSRIGLTFANGLRALLRQDPNIIMVGEIRDNETANMATQAALTGHLVLSTLHTNDAVTALPRLIEMDVPTFLIASTTNVVIAQRLVRKICLNCIESYTLTKKSIEELEKQINVEFILKALQAEGVIMSNKQSFDELLFYRGKGCKQCNSEGYKGRIGIYEVLQVSDTISRLIMEQATADQIRKAAIEEGMLLMVQDGFIKAKMGLTTIEEVLRVTKE
ncbi:MAG: Flp pilus assembly complex ATPase component TadA [Candidatus Nomurabacteria bacterium]|nr:MAG: Flp pilus assembly complex ATPase component TadA [Candidatus Nomurabacteria bacterium]